MTSSAGNSLEQRLLVLAPTPKDATLTQDLLHRAGVTCLCCADLDAICRALSAGAGAVLLAEEAVLQNGNSPLSEWLSRQPPWSDLPVLILSRKGADSPTVRLAMDQLGNVTVLERPIPVATLVSAVRTALRSRQRQYQIRDYLSERERHMQTQALLAAIVESSDDAIIGKTLDGIVLTWNLGAQRLFGYTAAEMIGQSILKLFPPQRHAEESEILARLRRGERIEHFETIRVAKDGRRIDMSLTVSPVRAADGTIIGASQVARDISQRKQAEAALREADRRKDEFLATLAHELRNPLAPIRSGLELMKLIKDDPDTLETTRNIMERQTRQLIALVDDLLDVSRITRGKMILRKCHVRLSDVIEDAVQASRPFLDESDHTLFLQVDAAPIYIDGDPHRLAQIVSNLLNNAAKYTPAGGSIELIVKREGSQASIVVSDTGIGIAPEMQHRVFEMFAQISSVQDKQYPGLGIGLALVKTLVEMHGGSIDVHSDGEGQGSTFTVHLPILDAAQVEGQRIDSSSDAPARLRQRVLVVDDNKPAAELLSSVVRMLGNEVRIAHNGEEALAVAAQFRPDIVLMDLGMPRMNGYEAARRIREQPWGREMVLVALTGWGQEKDKEHTRDVGFDHHLVKPAEPAAIRALLAARSAASKS